MAAYCAAFVGARLCSVKDARIRFATKTPFWIELKRRVDAHFEATGESRGGGRRMLLKTAVIFAWLFAGYAAALVWGPSSWLAVIAFGLSCGLATAGLGMSVQHDGGHRAYSERPWLNRAAAAVLDFVGASSHVWRVKHGIVHHTYPNIEGADDDIEAGVFGRLAPGQPHRPMHRWQHLYLWPLYGFLTAKWFIYDDLHDLVRGRVGNHPLRWPRGAELAIFVVGKLAHLSWAIVVPMLVLGPVRGLLFYAALSAACGVTLAVVFQLAHCVEEAEFFAPTGPQELDFAAHQLATTVDFARRSKLVTWYVGGLNFQAVHHLFPRVCHLHYPALAEIIEATAAEYGVRYTATDRLSTALASHYRWLERMGAGEVREAPVEAETGLAA